MHRRQFQNLKEELGVKTRSQRYRCRLSEDARTGKPHRVDREQGVIYGVKLIGLHSDNPVKGVPQVKGRRYLLEALKAAIPFYEGTQVNRDHLTEDDESRSSLDAIGEVRNVRAGDDGLYGDLYLIQPFDKFTEKLLWAAEHMPNAFGLSPHHHVAGEPQGSDFVITEILGVESVDIVRRAATTAGLFEGHMTDTERKEETVTEMDGATLGMEPEKKPEEVMEEEPAISGDWKQDLVAAIGKLVSSDLPEDHEMAKKIMGMLKPASAEPVVSEAEEEPEEEEEEETMESKTRKAPTQGVLALENTALKLCLQQGVKPSDVFLEALVGLGSEAKMRVLIEGYGKTADKPAKTPEFKPQKPKSSGSTVTESRTTTPSAFRLPTSEEYGRAILN